MPRNLIALVAVLATGVVGAFTPHHTKPRNCHSVPTRRIVYGETVSFEISPPSPIKYASQRFSLNLNIRAGQRWEITSLTTSYQTIVSGGPVDRLDFYLVLNGYRFLIQHFQPPDMSFSYLPTANTGIYQSPITVGWRDTLQLEVVTQNTTSNVPPYVNGTYTIQAQGTIERDD